MGQTNSIADRTVLTPSSDFHKVLIQAAIFLICVMLCESRGNGISLKLETKDGKTDLQFLCTIEDAKLPISFLKDDNLLARCYVKPVSCITIPKNSFISFNSAKSQSTFTIWGLKSVNGDWKCTYGGRNDSSFNVHIKGNSENIACTENNTPHSFKERIQLENTPYLMFGIFIFGSTVVYILSVILKGWMKKISLPRVFKKFTHKQQLGIRVSTSCTLSISLLFIAYYLNDTKAHNIAGCIISAVFEIVVPVMQNLTDADGSADTNGVSGDGFPLAVGPASTSLLSRADGSADTNDGNQDT